MQTAIICVDVSICLWYALRIHFIFGVGCFVVVQLGWQNRLYPHWIHQELYIWLILLWRLLYFEYSCILITANAATIYLKRLWTDSCRIERYILLACCLYCHKVTMQCWKKQSNITNLFNDAFRFNWNKLLNQLCPSTYITFNILSISDEIFFNYELVCRYDMWFIMQFAKRKMERYE